MFKRLISGAMLCMIALGAWAQRQITVQVLDAQNDAALPGATVKLMNPMRVQETDTKGVTHFSSLPPKNLEFQITFLGFHPKTEHLAWRQTRQFDTIIVRLHRTSVVTEEILVRATRAGDQSPTTYKNLGKEELSKNNLGPDLPYLLDQTPGVVVSSDAGAGVGYTGLRIRGSDPTRVNVTINGIPLNNPESMGAFLINLPDLASSIDNLQIQRGVGTSTNGAGAFGGSINMETNRLRPDAYAELDNSVGSYQTWKHTLRLGTGLLGHGFSFDGRLSQIRSEGYIDRAFSRLQSYFLTGAWHGKKSLIRANLFSGKERTYQAWNGVPEEMLAINRRFNEFTYKDQTDNYTQTHYQLHFSHKIAPSWDANAALHYTKGAGYYEELREQDDFAKYGLTEINIGDSSITQTDLVRRRWLDNDFYGATYGLHFNPSDGRVKFTLGGAYNEYLGKHFGEVIWARFASDSDLGDKYYEDDAVKKDFNIFAKATYSLEHWAFFADLQYRWISYAFLGYDRNLTQLDQTAYLNFFNPKIGVTYAINPLHQLYGSLSMANKEPIRDDYVESSIDSRPHPERLYNVELGWRATGANWHVGLNTYGMFYKDQLIMTGQINDVGELIRHNVPESYRIGLEMDARWQLHQQLAWSVTGAWSDNKILNYTEFVDLHDYSGQQAVKYAHTHIAMSPSFVGSSEWAFQPWPHTEIALLSKYVSRQYLDNTSAKDRSLDGYFLNNLRLAYQTSGLGIKKIRATLAVNNLFGVEYASNGYTWGHLNPDGSRAHYNYYYPQATTNFLFGLSLSF